MTADDHIRENSRPEEKNESWQKSILLYLHDLIYMLAGIMIAFLLVFRLVIVSGDSMYSFYFFQIIMVIHKCKNFIPEQLVSIPITSTTEVVGIH